MTKTDGLEKNRPARRMYYEASAQRGVIAWARKHASDLHPALAWLHSIPNGGRRSPHDAAMERDLGMTAGVPDLFLPWGTDEWNGLYIEMKAFNPKTKYRGRLSEAQREFFDYAGGAGYRCEVAYTSAEAVALICDYLGIEGAA